PTPGQNPGRTNLVEADGVKVLIDYGHNVPALEALAELVSSLPANRRISVASAPGNRRDEDLAGLGAQLARMHDSLYVCETDPRGRPAGEAAGLLRDGADSADSPCRAEVVMDEHDAVEKALDEANEGDLLVLLVDDIETAIHRVRGRSFTATAGAGA
ncbi:MAG: cyanophycin synthetase, partial [Arenicellales bacterium]